MLSFVLATLAPK